jgi:hypothetical protein
MGIRNDASSLIFFAYWYLSRLPAVGREDACLPVGREDQPWLGKSKRLIINFLQILLLSLLPTGKVADNQIS